MERGDKWMWKVRAEFERDEKTLKTICSRERREETVISVYIGESWRV